MSNRINRQGRGLTLVELMVALSIVAIVSTSVVGLLHAAAEVTHSVNSNITNEVEVGNALHRIVQETRVCTSLTVPTGVSGGTTFSLVTEPDASNNNACYALTYSLVQAADGTTQLQESDPRYGSSVLINNVKAFDVRLKATGSPAVVVISITAGAVPGVTRTIRVFARNI